MHGSDPFVALAGAPSPEVESAAARTEISNTAERYRFCTEGMVRGPWRSAQETCARLRDRGDSLIVIRAGDLLKLHVHTDQPDDVFAYLRTLGELVTHKAEDMRRSTRRSSARPARTCSSRGAR